MIYNSDSWGGIKESTKRNEKTSRQEIMRSERIEEIG